MIKRNFICKTKIESRAFSISSKQELNVVTKFIAFGA